MNNLYNGLAEQFDKELDTRMRLFDNGPIKFDSAKLF